MKMKMIGQSRRQIPVSVPANSSAYWGLLFTDSKQPKPTFRVAKEAPPRTIDNLRW